MPGSPWVTKAVTGGGQALAIALAVTGCGKKSSSAAGDAAPAEVTAITSAEASAVTMPEAASSSPGAPRQSAPRKSQTQEEVFEHAKEQVASAMAEAKEKKPDCAKIVDELDVSFATVEPPMGEGEHPIYAAFAACAEKEQRWRLLRAVADAIIAGDPTQKSTYYLPRALIGLAQYDAAARLSAAALKVWPKEGEAYTTGALASTRLEDWEATKKEAEQALLIQRQRGVSDEVNALAHIFKAEALLHLGKIDESSKELDAAKKIKASSEDSEVARLRERNDVVKRSGLLVEADLPDEVPIAVYPFLLKPLPLTGGLVTMRLQVFADKPVAIRVEVSLAGVGETIGKSLTGSKGREQTQRYTPPLAASFKVKDLKDGEKHDLSYKVTSGDGTVLYEQSKSVTVLGPDELPTAIQVHGTDEKLVPELVAAWVTPSAKPVAAMLEAARKRAPEGAFTGSAGATLPQVKAVWDELRERGFSFARDPAIGAEASRHHRVRLPSAVLADTGGHALEGTVLFASLFEAMGLDVLIVRTPGHAFVGWLPSKADRAEKDSMSAAVSSPVGSAFFLETTQVHAGPVDAAMLRGAAELVDGVTKKIFDDGRGSIVKLASARKLGIVAQAD